MALIAEVSLKVLPVAPAQATLRFELDQARALQQLHAWGGQPLPLNASCWVEDAGVPQLYLRLRGAVAAVESACRLLGGERLDPDQAGPDWDACRDQRLPWFQQLGGRDLWRISVPQTAPVLDLPEPPLVEWHGGLRWVRADADDAAAVREAAVAAGGSATLFRSNSGAAGLPRFDRVSPAVDRIQRELKRQFDPSGIFNRGRLFDHD